jgi:hypothetical protein
MHFIKKKLKLSDAIEIEWIDSMDHSGFGWEFLEDVDFEKHYNSMPIKTIGYFVNETEESITTTASMAKPEGNVSLNGMWTIPKGCIKKIRLVK